MANDLPHILIAGAGYAGLAAYLALRPACERGEIALTVCNDTDAHLLLPELPLYLAGTEGEKEVRIALHDVVRPPAELLVARVHSLRVDQRAVVTDGEAGTQAADGLIAAIGAVPDDFGVPGVGRFACVIGRWDDAKELRAKLMDALHRRAGGKVVVVGGGFTGVEIAAELASAGEHGLSVTLVAPHLLEPMPREVCDTATRALRQLGVQILLPARAEAVEAGRVRLQGGTVVEATLVIWAAGTRANPAIAASSLHCNKRGQAHVDACLRAAPGVYCAGDCAAVTDPETGRAVPSTAQAALQEGPAAAAALLAELTGAERKPFNPRNRGFLVSLGSEGAAGTVFGHAVAGSDVAWLKRLIETYHAFHIGGLRSLGLRLRRAVTGEREPALAGAHPTS